METIVRDKMMERLVEKGLINNSQHGFMAGRSCTTNLLEFFKEVDEGSPVDVVFLDFAKAFN